FVEHEVDDAQNRREPWRERLSIGNLVWDSRARDLLLRSSEALRDRHLRGEESARDLRVAQTSQRAQREGDLSLLRESRVAAGEDQAELVVRDGRDLDRVLWAATLFVEAERERELALLGLHDAQVPKAIYRFATRGGREPRAGRSR